MLLYIALFLGAVFLIVNIWSRMSRRPNKAISLDSEKFTRALEPNEEMFEEVHQYENGNVCAILRITSKTSLVAEYVKTALDILIERHQLLKCAIVRGHTTATQAQRYFRNVSIDCEMILKRSETEAHQWQLAVEENCGVVFETVNGPLWMVTWLQETFDKNLQTYENTIIFICHHAIVDGTSIMNLPKQFIECVNSIPKGQSNQRTPHYPIVPGVHARTAYHLDKLDWSPWQQMLLIPQILRVIVKILSPFYLRIHVNNGVFFRIFPPVFQSFRNVKSRTRIVHATLPTKDVQKLLQCTRGNNCTVTGAIVTACHFALADLMKEETECQNLEFLWDCTTSCRRNCIPSVPKDYIGYYIALLQQKIKVPALRNSNIFWKVAQETSDKLHQDIRNRSHLSNLHWMRHFDVKESKNLLLQDSHLQTRNFSLNMISNVGRVDWPEQDHVTYKMTETFFLASDHLWANAFKHYICTVKETGHWVMCYNPRVVMETTAKKYMELTIKSLHDAIEHI